MQIITTVQIKQYNACERVFTHTQLFSFNSLATRVEQEIAQFTAHLLNQIE